VRVMSKHQSDYGEQRSAKLLLKIRRPDSAFSEEFYLESVRTIGRSADNTIALLDEAAVDRTHARVSAGDDGSFLLSCESGNTVLVDGFHVTNVRLVPGIQFRIGRISFECVSDRVSPEYGQAAQEHRSNDLLTLLNELLVLFRESAVYQREVNDVVSVLAAAESVVRRLRCRFQLSDKAFKVALVGQADAEKSLLVNALLGEEYAPIHGSSPRTCPVEFRHAPQYSVKLQSSQRMLPRVWECDGPGRIKSKLEDLFTEGATGQIMVTAPVALLCNGLQLLDLPAVAGPGNGPGTFSQTTLADFLQRSGANVAWVVNDPQTVAAGAREFYRVALGQICDELVVLGGGDWSREVAGGFRRLFDEVFDLRSRRRTAARR
jgi:hypothetical protein